MATVYYNTIGNITPCISSTYNHVWNGWIANSTSTTTVWINWVSTGTSSCTSANLYTNQMAAVWINWVSTGTSSCTSANLYTNQMAAPMPSAEHQAAMMMQQAQMQQAHAAAMAAHTAQQADRNAATKKSFEWLNENLTEAQRTALKKHGWFLVEGGKSKKTYRINGDRYAGNIHELDKAGKPIAKLCVHAGHEIPLGDQLLGQALMLRHDEDHILSRANRTPLAA